MKKFFPIFSSRVMLPVFYAVLPCLAVALCVGGFTPSSAQAYRAQAATTATRAVLINNGMVSADGTITATATGTGGTSTATLEKPLGVITSGAITTAAAADHVMTVTNASVTAASIIRVSINKNGSTGWPVITSIEPGSGSYVIRITNMHASAAFNAALKLMVHVDKY